MRLSGLSGIGSRGRSELAAIVSPGRRLVGPTDAAAALGITPDEAAKKLSRWAAAGWLRRARRGLYVPVPVDATNPAAWSEDALVVATAVWSPCYFTGWTAASHWSLTDQVFRTTVLKTTNRVRASPAVLLDHEYLVRHTSADEMSWGLATEWERDARLRFSDAARTVVDILDEPRLGGGIRHCADILSVYLDDHDATLLVDYGDRLGNRTVFKRLGFLLETLGRGDPSLIDACRSRLSEGVSPLDPGGRTTGRRAMRWRLRVNAEIRPEEPT